MLVILLIQVNSRILDLTSMQVRTSPASQNETAFVFPSFVTTLLLADPANLVVMFKYC